MRCQAQLGVCNVSISLQRELSVSVRSCSRCSLLLFTLLLLKAETWGAGIGSSSRQQEHAAPCDWLPAAVNHLLLSPGGPSLPGREVDLKFGQLCAAQVNLTAALGGRCGTEDRHERRTAKMKLCRNFLGSYK